MKAIRITGYGGVNKLSLDDVPQPEIAPNQILVRNYAGTLTQADIMMRKGTPWFGRLFIGLTKPKVPVTGTGFAGKVEKVGSAVTRFAPGDDVFGETTTEFGAHAEYVALDENGLIEPIPANLSYAEAAPISDGALTVYNFLVRISRLQKGQSILIIGAAGGLGTSAVQLAVHLGAEVTGVASTKNEPFVRQQGAHAFIDYTRTDLKTLSERYDFVFDTVGKFPFSSAKKLLKDDGTYLSPVLSLTLLSQMLKTGCFGGQKAKFSATGLLSHAELKPMLHTLTVLFEQDTMRTAISERFPLEEMAKAHALVETGHKRANVVLEIAKAPERAEPLRVAAQ